MQWATINIITSTWDEISLTSASPKTITQPQNISPVLFDPLSSQLNRDPIWPFCQTSSCYLLLRSPVVTKCLCLSVCGLWADEAESVKWWSTGVHQSCLSNVLKGNKEPRLFFFFSLKTSPSLLLIVILINTLSNLKAGQQRKSRPCGRDTHSLSLVLRRTVLKFPDLKSGKYYRQTGKIPAAVVLIFWIKSKCGLMFKLITLTKRINAIWVCELWFGTAVD